VVPITANGRFEADGVRSAAGMKVEIGSPIDPAALCAALEALMPAPRPSAAVA
jgi:hypothetical protein